MNTHNDNHKRVFSPLFSFVTISMIMHMTHCKPFDADFLVVRRHSLFNLMPGAIAVSTVTRPIKVPFLRRLHTRLILIRQ